MPKECPACGAKIFREGAYYFCPAGLSCPLQVIGRVIHYGSRDAIYIEGLGNKTAKDIVRKDLVKDIADLYKLSADDLLKLEGIAQKSAAQLHEAVQGAKNPRLDRFLYALGIRHVSQRAARVLAQRYRSLNALRKARRDELEKTEEIGPEISRSVTKFFEEEENRLVLERLEKAGIKVKEIPSEKKASPLEGKAFVFTGKLESRTRKEAQRLVEDLGGRTTSSVSGETDYVVQGGNPGSKLEEAKKHDVRILDENRFEKLIGEQ